MERHKGGVFSSGLLLAVLFIPVVKKGVPEAVLRTIRPLR